MPVHDWTRVDAGIFHAFHHEWISEIGRALNRGLLPGEYYALPEQYAGGVGPDVLTLQRPAPSESAKRSIHQGGSGIVLATSPPQVRFRIKSVPQWYALKKKAVVVRHISDHRVVAVFEILSPGNKSGRSAITSFVQKAQDLLARGIHFSLVDLFPPTPRDPEGIHPAIWGDDNKSVFQFDSTRPLTCASYIGGADAEAFVEPAAVGDKLPDMPLFLTPIEYVYVPLERTYQAAFDALPDLWREVLTAAHSPRSMSKKRSNGKPKNGRSKRG